MKRLLPSALLSASLLLVFRCSDDSNPIVSGEKEIVAIDLSGNPGVSEIIHEPNNVITIVLAYGSTTVLTPAIEVSANATIHPASGESVDLSQPVIYTVTAEDGSHQEYILQTRETPPACLPTELPATSENAVMHIFYTADNLTSVVHYISNFAGKAMYDSSLYSYTNKQLMRIDYYSEGIIQLYQIFTYEEDRIREHEYAFMNNKYVPYRAQTYYLTKNRITSVCAVDKFFHPYGVIDTVTYMYDTRGNVAGATHYRGKTSEVAYRIDYAHDDKINPYRIARLPDSAIIFFSPETHSRNNITRETVIVPSQGTAEVTNYTYTYSPDGYPLSRTTGVVSPQPLRYQCR
ncbi:DUF5018 domain-containing protein [Dawidia soli]|uniref:DUF5018 domain-containing protein n=1 Tax=Dawidia soli TaxID=2782352 RepID=A0AAP2GD29_9BACT|nr:DUF5018 domain-containing protein [Dawidia soli]MBT1686812.1 hypothetical protein [Dawidia soli]